MRLTPSISAMSPNQIMRKEPFYVPIPSAVSIPNSRLVASAFHVAQLDNVQREVRTQADFVREFYPTSHKINELKYYPNTMFVDKQTGAMQAKIRSRVSAAFQQYIHLQRKEALLGNNVGMRLISDSTNEQMIDRLAFLREGWEDRDMEVIVSEAIDADFRIADVAVYVFMDGGRVHSRIFSYDKGDVLYPHYDSLTGELALLGRTYVQCDWDGNRHEYLDVIDRTSFVTYRKKDDGTEWEREGNPVPHGFNECPVSYHRRNSGAVWSASQGLIESWEVGMSQFSENNAAYALRILYTLGGELEVMTNTDGTPSRIDSPDKDAKVGFLEPAQGADGAFAKQLDILRKEIMRGSFVVETPEIKSGADISSRTIKMLFADTYMKALSDSMEYQPFLNKILRLFKYGYLMEKGRVNESESLRVKAYLDPFIFLSENDIISAIQMLVSSGCMSVKTATELAYNIGYSSPDEIRRITQEAHDELVANSGTGLQNQTHNPVNDSRAALANA